MCRCFLLLLCHVLYPNGCDDSHQSSSAALLLGSQENGWPLGCLAKESPRAANLQFLVGTQT